MTTYQEFIQQNEDRDGVRLSWNVWPSRYDKVLDNQVNCRTLAEEENAFEPLPFLNYLWDLGDFYA